MATKEPVAQMPSAVQVGPFVYAVAIDDAGLNAEAVTQRQGLDGVTDMATKRIYLRSKLAPEYEAETLLHEVIHTINDMVGLMDDGEETRTRAQSPALLDVLRRNPQLVSFLLAQ